MSSEKPQRSKPIGRVLVIDDQPLIPLAFQQILRSIDPSALVEYSGDMFMTLSATAYAGANFDLIVIGSLHEGLTQNGQQTITELRERFGQPLVMVYSSTYDPLIIEKMRETGIDAYVHKYESVEEVSNACRQLSTGHPYISGMFHTLYYDYGYQVKK
jgi:DNA-binding NarL/FixJ family response regulator